MFLCPIKYFTIYCFSKILQNNIYNIFIAEIESNNIFIFFFEKIYLNTIFHTPARQRHIYYFQFSVFLRVFEMGNKLTVYSIGKSSLDFHVIVCFKFTELKSALSLKRVDYSRGFSSVFFLIHLK